MRRKIVLLPSLLLLSAHVHSQVSDSQLNRLKLPQGFHIAIFAEADSARMMAFSPGGVLLVTESGEGKVVALPDPKHTGKAERSVVLLSGLKEPHGLGFYQGRLYVAETDKV